MCYYDHLRGDMNASLGLLNSYLSKRCSIIDNKMKSPSANKKESYNGSIFKKKETKDFLSRFHSAVQQSFEGTLSEFQHHSSPLVSLPTMQAFLHESPTIFGDLWDLMLKLRGKESVRSGSKRAARSAKTEEEREIDVFFEV